MKQQQIGKKEIMMILVTIALLITLGTKSIIFDEVRNLSPAEQQFKDFADYSIARDYDGMLEKARLMIYRIYEIEMADKDQNAVLKYQDPDTGEKVVIIQEGRYNAKVRGYVFWIFPVNHFDVTAEIAEIQE